MRMLHRLLTAGLFIMVSVGAGAAADFITVPVESAGVAVNVTGESFDWNGFYAGVYGIGQTSPERDTEVGLGITLGVNATFDFFLVGGEVSLHGLTGDTIDTAYGQITGRGGVLLTEDLLAYVSAGYGMELTGTGETTALAGGGLEYAVNESFSVNAEYLRGFSIEGDNPTDQITFGAKFHF
jgi:outer membrane immunogenic protein